MASVKISCPHCGQHYELDAAAVGQRATCDKCGAEFTVARPAPPPPAQQKTRLYPCPDCRNGVSPRARMCPHCGRPLEPDISLKGSASAVWVFIITPIAFFFLADAFGLIVGVAAAVWLQTITLVFK